MEIKAVFLDIDGTFFDHSRNCVLPESIEACKKLKTNGYKVVLCSGRPKEMAEDLHVFELLEWDGYIGCSGGVVYNQNYEIIHENAYSDKQMEEMFRIAEENGFCLYSFGKNNFMTKELTPLSKRVIEEYHLKTPEVRGWKKEKLSAISALGEAGADFSVFYNIEGLTHTFSTPYCIDFVKEGVHKANGIKQMMKYWGFAENDYIAFGDSTNDVEMLKHAKIGHAMGNGHESAKAAADVIIGDSSEPTIAQTLAKLNLI